MARGNVEKYDQVKRKNPLNDRISPKRGENVFGKSTFTKSMTVFEDQTIHEYTLPKPSMAGLSRAEYPPNLRPGLEKEPDKFEK